MIYKSADKYEMCPFKVEYFEKGVLKTAYTDSPQFYREMEAKHGNIAITNTNDFVPTEEQLKRLSEVQNIPQRHLGDLQEYVENGNFPEGEDHCLRKLQEKKENEALKETVEMLVLDSLGV